jgi:hypothetical protein
MAKWGQYVFNGAKGCGSGTFDMIKYILSPFGMAR